MEFKQEELLEREIEIANYLVHDFTSKMIVIETGLNKKIVMAHISNMMEKLKVEGMDELIKLVKGKGIPLPLSPYALRGDIDHLSLRRGIYKSKSIKTALHLSAICLLFVASCLLVFAGLYYFAQMAKLLIDAQLQEKLFAR